MATGKERLAQFYEEVVNANAVDRVEEFCTEVATRFGWQLAPPLHANRTPEEYAPRTLRARIAADNALDAELWEHARETYDRR